MVRIYYKNVTKENMPTNQDTEPEQEEKEKEEDQIDQPRKEDQTDKHRNERALVDGNSKKDKRKEPMSSTDPSADTVFGEDQIDQNRDKRALIGVSSEKDKGKEPMGSTDPSGDKVFGEDQIDQNRDKRALIGVSSEKDKGKEPMGSTDPSGDKVFGEDQTDQHRKERALVGGSSKKDKGKAPMSYTDPSADEVDDDDIPLIKMLKMVKKVPKSSPPVSGILDKEPPKGSIRFVTKNSTPSSTVVSCSRGKNEEPEIQGLRETLAACLSQQRNVPGTSKWKAPRPLRTRQGTPHNIRCTHKEDMYQSLWGRPDWQMDAICALFRHMMSHEAQRRFTDPHFTRVGMIVNMLTCGNVDGPCIKSDEELEEMWKGSVTFCLGILSSYTRELYYLYYGGLDPYFFFIP